MHPYNVTAVPINFFLLRSLEQVECLPPLKLGKIPGNPFQFNTLSSSMFRSFDTFRKVSTTDLSTSDSTSSLLENILPPSRFLSLERDNNPSRIGHVRKQF